MNCQAVENYIRRLENGCSYWTLALALSILGVIIRSGSPKLSKDSTVYSIVCRTYSKKIIQLYKPHMHVFCGDRVLEMVILVNLEKTKFQFLNENPHTCSARKTLTALSV